MTCLGLRGCVINVVILLIVLILLCPHVLICSLNKGLLPSVDSVCMYVCVCLVCMCVCKYLTIFAEINFKASMCLGEDNNIHNHHSHTLYLYSYIMLNVCVCVCHA